MGINEMEFQWRLNWWYRPTQLDGFESSVADYYDCFCDWKANMELNLCPADEADYVKAFIQNLKSDVRSRLPKYIYSGSLICAFLAAKLEESFMRIDESFKKSDAHKPFDEMPSRSPSCSQVSPVSSQSPSTDVEDSCPIGLENNPLDNVVNKDEESCQDASLKSKGEISINNEISARIDSEKETQKLFDELPESVLDGSLLIDQVLEKNGYYADIRILEIGNVDTDELLKSVAKGGYDRKKISPYASCKVLEEMPGPFLVKPTEESKMGQPSSSMDSDIKDDAWNCKSCEVSTSISTEILELDVELCVGKVLSLTFDPGGNPLYHQGCSFFKPNNVMQSFDFKSNELDSARVYRCWTDLYSRHENDQVHLAFGECRNVIHFTCYDAPILFDPGGRKRIIHILRSNQHKKVMVTGRVSNWRLPTLRKIVHSPIVEEVYQAFDKGIYLNLVEQIDDMESQLLPPTMAWLRRLDCDFPVSKNVRQDLDTMPGTSPCELWVGKMLLFTFDPGGSSWTVNGCDAFDFSNDRLPLFLELQFLEKQMLDSGVWKGYLDRMHVLIAGEKILGSAVCWPTDLRYEAGTPGGSLYHMRYRHFRLNGVIHQGTVQMNEIILEQGKIVENTFVVIMLAISTAPQTRFRIHIVLNLVVLVLRVNVQVSCVVHAQDLQQLNVQLVCKLSCSLDSSLIHP